VESESGQPLDSFLEDTYRVIEISPTTAADVTRLRIRAQRLLESQDGRVEFEIPGIVNLEDVGLVQDATLDLVNSGRQVLVVDLDASTGLSRIAKPMSTSAEANEVSSFRLLTQGVSPKVVGAMIEQPPRVVLASEATVELDGPRLRTTVDWNLKSGLDLEGRIPIRIPTSVRVEASESGLAVTPPSEQSVASLATAELESIAAPRVSEGTRGSEGNWVVTVDELPAKLEKLGDDRYVLVSDRLTSGSMEIRWRHIRDLLSPTAEGSIEPVSLPRPDFADVTLRGSMKVTLQGNQRMDLVSVDSPMLGQLDLGQLPRDPLRLRLRSRLTAPEELSVRQTILRTVVGRGTRHEQVLATVQGGDHFRVGLPEGAGEVSVQAWIDGGSQPVRREGSYLIVTLPGDRATHVVDLRVWLALTTPSSVATIEPTLRLPVGMGRVYWQIVAPLDGHVVWAAPTLGRSMAWRFDRWRLYREPSHSDQDLNRLARSVDNPMPPGNRYLFLGSDLRAFRALIVSRVVLWMCVGGFVLALAVILTNFPRTRHPLMGVVMAVAFGGLLTIAPDAAVLAGQFGIVALVLVIVMIAVRSLLAASPSDRVFSTSGGVAPSGQPSTRSLKKPPTPELAVQGSTQALPSSAPEASL
jgi:hypothetical protein